jgi:hypothetical protein
VDIAVKTPRHNKPTGGIPSLLMNSGKKMRTLNQGATNWTCAHPRSEGALRDRTRSERRRRVRSMALLEIRSGTVRPGLGDIAERGASRMA